MFVLGMTWGLGLAMTSAGWGQEEPVANPAVVFAEIKVDFEEAPDLDAKGLPKARPANVNWMIITFTYQALPLAGMEFVDELTFKVYIEGLSNEYMGGQLKETPVVLTGEAVYVNVPKSKEVYGAFFVHPDAVARYGIEKNANKFNVHVEAFEGGKLQATIGKNRKEKQADWYKAGYPTKAGIVYTQAESPFVASNTESFPALKLPSGK
jgi:hypothetical protein